MTYFKLNRNQVRLKSDNIFYDWYLTKEAEYNNPNKIPVCSINTEYFVHAPDALFKVLAYIGFQTVNFDNMISPICEYIDSQGKFLTFSHVPSDADLTEAVVLRGYTEELRLIKCLYPVTVLPDHTILNGVLDNDIITIPDSLKTSVIMHARVGESMTSLSICGNGKCKLLPLYCTTLDTYDRFYKAFGFAGVRLKNHIEFNESELVSVVKRIGELGGSVTGASSAATSYPVRMWCNCPVFVVDTLSLLVGVPVITAMNEYYEAKTVTKHKATFQAVTNALLTICGDGLMLVEQEGFIPSSRMFIMDADPIKQILDTCENKTLVGACILEKFTAERGQNYATFKNCMLFNDLTTSIRKRELKYFNHIQSEKGLYMKL